MLNWMERLVRRRRECPELGWGDWAVLGPRIRRSSRTAPTGNTPSNCHHVIFEQGQVPAMTPDASPVAFAIAAAL